MAKTPKLAAPHYQVLARKYRPRAFDEVVGQETVVSTLRNAITQGRLHHAYLFSGTRGVGKTTLARLFARALNCAEGPTISPCGACDACREIAAGSAMDVIEIDGASNRKVEDVDPLREAARYAPARDRHKIFIIDEVHMLSETAFNALLKILEEPPPRTFFIFATTEPGEVPETILSRCLHLVCRRVGRREIAAASARVAATEGIEASSEALDLLAGLAEGSMRDALSLLDQAIAFSGGKVTAESIREGLGLIDRGLVMEFLGSIASADNVASLSIIERLSQAGADLTHFSREALARARDAMICKVANAAAAGLEGDEAAANDALAARFSPEGLLRLTQALLDLSDRIRRDENPRFLLEIAALKMIRLTDITPLEDLILRLDAAGSLSSSRPSPPSKPGGAGPRAHSAGADAASGAESIRAALRQTAPPAPLPAAKPPSAPPSPGAAAEPAARGARSPQASRLLERISAKKVALGTLLGQVRGIEVAGEQVVIDILPTQGFLVTALADAETIAFIQEEASHLLGRPATLRVQTQEAVDAANESPRERLRSEAMADPAVRAVMEKFKGQIVDIRENS